MTQPVNHSAQFTIGLERAEVAAWADVCNAASPETDAACGIQLVSFPSGCLSMAAAFDILALNRVIGAGLETALDDAELQGYITAYRSAGVPRFFLQLHPEADTPEVRARLEANGYTHYNNWVKLCRTLDDPPPFDSDLQIDQIGTPHAEAFGQVLRSGFDWPEGVGRWIAESVGRPGWRHYCAFDGNRPVATGAYFRDGTYAWIDLAATLDTHRGRGAQAAILARRITDARAEGCTHLVVETAEQTETHEAPSYRNVLRFGFEVAYIRPNFLYQFT